MTPHALIFDLDGVIADTASYHFRSWQQVVHEQGLAFSWELNERLRSLTRSASLDVILAENRQTLDEATRAAVLQRKNSLYLALLQQMDSRARLPGVADLIADARAAAIRLAVASASRNAALVLHRLNLRTAFNAVIDGTSDLPGKPAPDVFLAAAQQLQVAPRRCVVIEDAAVGIAAARRAGMWAVGVGPAAHDPAAHLGFADLAGVRWRTLVDGLSAVRDAKELS